MPSPRRRHELGPMTLAEVLDARQGVYRDERVPLADRPIIRPVDERGNPVAAGGKVELRAEGDSADIVIDGYASVYDTPYEMYGGKDSAWGWDETVEAGAGAKSLAETPDVVFLVNHSGLPLARTKSGTLELSEDKHGLRNVARLQRDDPDVARLVPKMERRDLDEESFAFRIVRQEWNEDYTERWITEYSIDRGDTSLVTFGANPHTHATLRFDELVAQLEVDPDGVLAQMRSTGEDPFAALARAHQTLGRLLEHGQSTRTVNSDGPTLDDVRRILATI